MYTMGRKGHRPTHRMHKIDERIISFLQQTIPGVQAIYRFGSAGTGSERRDSDVDIAFLPEASPDASVTWTLGGELAVLLGRDVDLVDLRGASTVMRSQVVSTGERIFGSHDADAFETMVYAAYALLNEERAGILDDIATRGTIHG
jgi:predicted nucleotidyltransferase